MNNGKTELEGMKDGQEQQTSEDDDGEDEEEEENDSFVVDDDLFDVDGDMQQHQRRKKAHHKKEKERREVPEQEEWGEKHDIEIFIENLFYLIASDNQLIQDKLDVLRSKALRAIEFEPFIRYRVVKPIYPLFEIPCENCFRINESPGVCTCNNQLKNVSELIEYPVWQMIN